MAKKKTKKRKKSRRMDPKLIAGKSKGEVGYAAKKSGKTARQVRNSIKKVGHSRRKVMQDLTTK